MSPKLSDGTPVEPSAESVVFDAVRDLLWKATQYGTTEDGDTAAYLLPKGTVHRLVGAMMGIGQSAPLRSPLATMNETDEPVDDHAAAIYWTARWATTAVALTDALTEIDRLRSAANRGSSR